MCNYKRERRDEVIDGYIVLGIDNVQGEKRIEEDDSEICTHYHEVVEAVNHATVCIKRVKKLCRP